jgi:hypothetical protein
MKFARMRQFVRPSPPTTYNDAARNPISNIQETPSFARLLQPWSDRKRQNRSIVIRMSVSSFVEAVVVAHEEAS